MPVQLPQRVANEMMMAASVMDEPRSVGQRLMDAIVGRTMPEQITSGLTGAAPGAIVPSNFLSRVAANYSLRKMPSEIAQRLIEDPRQILVNMSKNLQGRSPAYFTTRGPYFGTVNVDPIRSLTQRGYGGSPFRYMTHELGHAAQEMAGRPNDPFPGLLMDPKKIYSEFKGYRRGQQMSPLEALNYTRGEYLPLFLERAHNPIIDDLGVRLVDPEAYTRALVEWFR